MRNIIGHNFYATIGTSIWDFNIGTNMNYGPLSIGGSIGFNGIGFSVGWGAHELSFNVGWGTVGLIALATLTAPIWMPVAAAIAPVVIVGGIIVGAAVVVGNALGDAGNSVINFLKSPKILGIRLW